MKIHHIAYAVSNLEQSIESFLPLGYQVTQAAMDDIGRQVRIAFLEHKDSQAVIELIEPLSEDSPVSNYLKKMKGMATPYHICYVTEHMEQSLEELTTQGYFVTQMPEAAPAIDGRRVAFLMKKAAGVIELVEAEEAE